MGIICFVLVLFLIAIFVRIVLSWFPLGPDSALRPVVAALYAVTEPVLGPVRRMLPPVRIGTMGLDLSPILVVIGIQVVMVAFC